MKLRKDAGLIASAVVAPYSSSFLPLLQSVLSHVRYLHLRLRLRHGLKASFQITKDCDARSTRDNELHLTTSNNNSPIFPSPCSLERATIFLLYEQGKGYRGAHTYVQLCFERASNRTRRVNEI